MKAQRRPISLGERWRREANRGIDGQRLEQALVTLPSIRRPALRIRAGAITAEMEGAMGSINEVAIHVPALPRKMWPQVARILRRSAKMREALSEGRVPRSFDRLVARIGGEPLFPEARRVSWACTCGAPEQPCRHVLALHELFARRLDDKPYELLALRGVDLAGLLEQSGQAGQDLLPALAYGATEEPVLFPEGEAGDLDYVLARGQIASLLGVLPPSAEQAVCVTLAEFEQSAPEDGRTDGSQP